MITFNLGYEYSLGDASHRTSFIFNASTMEQAVFDVQNFFKSRKENIDMELHYFELRQYTVYQMREDGNLIGGVGWRFFEWSQDRTGYDLETFCRMKITEYRTKGL